MGQNAVLHRLAKKIKINHGKKALLVAMLGYLGYHCWPIIFIFGVAPSTCLSNFSGRVFVYYRILLRLIVFIFIFVQICAYFYAILSGIEYHNKWLNDVR